MVIMFLIFKNKYMEIVIIATKEERSKAENLMTKMLGKKKILRAGLRIFENNTSVQQMTFHEIGQMIVWRDKSDCASLHCNSQNRHMCNNRVSHPLHNSHQTHEYRNWTKNL
jgi:hypothetical protein